MPAKVRGRGEGGSLLFVHRCLPGRGHIGKKKKKKKERKKSGYPRDLRPATRGKKSRLLPLVLSRLPTSKGGKKKIVPFSLFPSGRRGREGKGKGERLESHLLRRIREEKKKKEERSYLSSSFPTHFFPMMNEEGREGEKEKKKEGPPA